jgi:hypothetical protein
LSAALVAGALCLEPLAQSLAGRSYPGESVVWPVEIAVGVALASFFVLTGLAFRRRAGPGLSEPTAT